MGARLEFFSRYPLTLTAGVFSLSTILFLWFAARYGWMTSKQAAEDRVDSYYSMITAVVEAYTSDNLKEIASVVSQEDLSDIELRDYELQVFNKFVEYIRHPLDKIFIHIEVHPNEAAFMAANTGIPAQQAQTIWEQVTKTKSGSYIGRFRSRDRMIYTKMVPLFNATGEQFYGVLQLNTPVIRMIRYMPFQASLGLIMVLTAVCGGVFLMFITLLSLKQALNETEERVHNRTRQLQNKNSELTSVLDKLKLTQEKMLLQEKMASIGQLTAGIAHEIKNPLNFVNNFSEMSVEMVHEMKQCLEESDYQLDDARKKEVQALLSDIAENSDKIRHHGIRADNIVRNMLLHSKDASLVEREPTNMNDLVQEYIGLAFHGLRAKDSTFNAKIETHLQPDLPNIVASKQDMGRVLLNILNNALYSVDLKRKELDVDDYVPLVQVETMMDGDKMVIKIHDNGLGIPEHVLDSVFQPFFTTKPTGVGTGLGLSICYNIVVQQQSGDIQVDSKAGEYAEFVIKMPLQAASSQE